MDPTTQIELRDAISSGRFGPIVRARHRRTIKDIAVKVARLETPEQYEEIAAQVSSLKKGCAGCGFLCHYQNGFFVEGQGDWRTGHYKGEEFWIIMDYCDGGTLQDLIDFSPGKSLEAPLIADVCASVTEGLRHLHLHGLVHGDLSTHNVLLTQRGQCKLGGVRLLPSISAASLGEKKRRQTFHGLPSIAPECLAGGPVSKKADIWALGALAMRMSDGRGNGSDDHSVENAATWSDSFNLFVFSCLARAPAQRVDAAKLVAMPFVSPVIQRLKEFNGCSRLLQAEVQSFRGKYAEARRKRLQISEQRHAVERAAAAASRTTASESKAHGRPQRRQAAVTADAATPRTRAAGGKQVVQCPRCHTVLKLPPASSSDDSPIQCGQCGVQHTVVSIRRIVAAKRRWDAPEAHGLMNLIRKLSDETETTDETKQTQEVKTTSEKINSSETSPVFVDMDELDEGEEVCDEATVVQPAPQMLDMTMPAPPKRMSVLVTQNPGVPAPPSVDEHSFFPPPMMMAKGAAREEKGGAETKLCDSICQDKSKKVRRNQVPTTSAAQKSAAATFPSSNHLLDSIRDFKRAGKQLRKPSSARVMSPAARKAVRRHGVGSKSGSIQESLRNLREQLRADAMDGDDEDDTGTWSD